MPEIAARAHVDALDGLIEAALAESGIGFDALDGVAATAGPGLIGGVIVGVMTAKGIAAARGLPFVAVNHLEGHALTPRLTDGVAFPYLLLLVSGGHCQLLIVEGVGRYVRLGTTIDDAVGEAFDKTAKLLGLGYPGGPLVEARGPRRRSAPLRPAAAAEGPAGLRLFVLRPQDRGAPGRRGAAARSGRRPDRRRRRRSRRRVPGGGRRIDRRPHPPRPRRLPRPPPAGDTLVVAGGVAANRPARLLQSLAAAEGLRFVAPPLRLCTDNGAMIAWAGIERLRLGLVDDLSFAPRPRWPLDPDGAESDLRRRQGVSGRPRLPAGGAAH